jgi:hypothetical protein
VDLAQLARDVHVRTIRSDGRTQVFTFARQHHHDGYLRSTADVPEPHSFTAEVQLRGEALQVEFAEDADSCHHSSHSGHSSHSDGGQSTPNPLHRYSCGLQLAVWTIFLLHAVKRTLGSRVVWKHHDLCVALVYDLGC